MGVEGERQIGSPIFTQWGSVEEANVKWSHSSRKWSTPNAMWLVLCGYFKFKKIRRTHCGANCNFVFTILRLYEKKVIFCLLTSVSHAIYTICRSTVLPYNTAN